MNNKEIMDYYDNYVMHTYGRQPIVLDHGHGAVLYDIDGNEYLDFFAGIAVNSIGQTDDDVVKAIQEQAEKMIHCSNIYYNEPCAILAKKLADISGLDKSFFGNSGAEANEGAIKLARKFTGKGDIITALDSFHGRTLVTVTATGQTKYSQDYKPLPPGFIHVPFNDIDELKNVITDNTAAIMLELIQGEGGVNIASKEYMKEVEALCQEKGIVLIIDEVQTGFGRCGEMFAFQSFDIKPDIVTFAKALGGGVPIGVVMANDKVANAFNPGDHGSTFGGNPLVCAAANAAIDSLINNKLVENSKTNGEYLKEKLLSLKDKYDFIEEVRGQGLMIGIQLSFDGEDFVDKMREKGVLINCTADSVLRLVPPLVVTKEQIDTMINSLDELFAEV